MVVTDSAYVEVLTLHQREMMPVTIMKKIANILISVNMIQPRKTELTTYKLHAYLQCIEANIFRLTKEKMQVKEKHTQEGSWYEGISTIQNSRLVSEGTEVRC